MAERKKESPSPPLLRPIKASFDGVDGGKVTIQANLPSDEMFAKLHEYCGAEGFYGWQHKKLLYVVGMIGLNIWQRKLHKEKYRSFEEFVRKEVVEKHQIDRATFMRLIRTFKTFPDMAMQDFCDIGQSTAYAAAKIASRPGIKPAEVDKMLESAKELTTAEFERRFSNKGVPRHSGYHVIRIVCSDRIKKAFAAWLEQQDKDPEQVITELIQSTS